jgi:hypothetical protein
MPPPRLMTSTSRTRSATEQCPAQRPEGSDTAFSASCVCSCLFFTKFKLAFGRCFFRLLLGGLWWGLASGMTFVGLLLLSAGALAGGGTCVASCVGAAGVDHLPARCVVARRGRSVECVLFCPIEKKVNLRRIVAPNNDGNFLDRVVGQACSTTVCTHKQSCIVTETHKTRRTTTRHTRNHLVRRTSPLPGSEARCDTTSSRSKTTKTTTPPFESLTRCLPSLV